VQLEGSGCGKQGVEEGDITEKGKGKDLERTGEGDVYVEEQTRRSLSSEVDVERGVERQEGTVVSNTFEAKEVKA
jgi:hypothetical protein